MGQRSEAFFNSLKTPKNIKGLIGQSEDADFDCKIWIPHKGELKSWKESVAKNACGFANATGGVIIIGLLAQADADGVDVVQEDQPVPDIDAVKSEALDAILKLVEPEIEVETKEIRLTSKSKQGYVLLHIHESEGSPRRSKATAEFYVRMASGTVPMMYFQIADRFGRRPHAQLIVELEDGGVRTQMLAPGVFERTVIAIVSNTGRGLARFPALRIGRTKGLMIPMHLYAPPPLWPLSDAHSDWFSLRGGSNDVVYPGEKLKIATLIQGGVQITGAKIWQFPRLEVVTEAVCDGMPAHRQSFAIEAAKS
jgi:hypothetical protein